MNSFEKTLAATIAAGGMSTAGVAGLPTEAEAMHHRPNPHHQEYRHPNSYRPQCPEHYSYNQHYRQCIPNIRRMRRQYNPNYPEYNQPNYHNQNQRVIIRIINGHRYVEYPQH